MSADVAEPGGAEQSIGDRVKDDVGVAVARKAVAMRHCNPAEYYRTVAGKGVDVEAQAGARYQPGGQQVLGLRPIRGRRQLLQRRVAGDGGNAHACCAHDHRLVGRSIPDQAE
jgi:hypothetical protein